MINEYVFADLVSLTQALTAHCLSVLQEQSDKPLVYLSGGTTPQPLYQQLAQSTLDFSRIDCLMVDERWVDYDQAGSNARFIDECFAANRGFLLQPMQYPGEDFERAPIALEAKYSRYKSRANLCILGMGPDGHTASFFPHSKGLSEALAEHNSQRVCGITAIPSEVTGAHIQRLSLTLNTIANSRNIVLLLTGQEKWQVYQTAKNTTDWHSLPIAALLQRANVDLDVYWCP